MIYNQTALRLIAAALVAVLFTACTGDVLQPATSADPEPAGTATPGNGLATTPRPGNIEPDWPALNPAATAVHPGLPAPSTLLRQPSVTDTQRFKTGAAYDSSRPSQLVEPTGTGLQLMPQWPAAGPDPNAGLAYAFFTFGLTGYDGAPTANLRWDQSPADYADCLLGFGNVPGDRWDWYPVPQTGQIVLPGMAPYISPNGRLLVVIAATGTSDCILRWLRIGADVAPVADITADPAIGRAPVTVNFDAVASADPDGVIIRYEWDLDNDGEFETDTGAEPTTAYLYSAASVYEVAVRVTDNWYNTATASTEVVISTETNEPPDAHLDVSPAAGPPPLLVTLDAGDSTDGDGSIIRYEWDWEGDGSYDQLTSTPLTSHTYARGLYSPRVRVTDNEAAVDTAQASVRAADDPLAAITVSIAGTGGELTGNAPLGVDADASGSTSPGGTITKYEWDWEGDGIFDEMTGDSPYAQHGYVSSGEYYVTVRVSDSLGGVDTAEIEVPVTVRGWCHSWGGLSDDYFNSVTCNGSDIYALGSTGSWGAGWTDALLLKVNSGGNLLWASTWGGGSIDYMVDVAVDSTGSAYICGYTWSSAPGGKDDLCVARLTSAGELDWAATWGRSEYDWGHALLLGSTGDVFVAGEATNEEHASMEDLIIISYSPTGNVRWAKTFNSGRDDTYPFLTEDGDGNIIVTGRSVADLNGVDGTVYRFTPAGELLSAKHWGGGAQDAFYRAIFDAEGNMYVTGYTESWGEGSEDTLLVKFDAEDNLVWARIWGTDFTEILDGVHLGADGFLYASGMHVTDTEGYFGLVLKYTTDGDFVSAMRLATSGTTKLWDGESMNSNYFMMAGSTKDAYGIWEPITGTETVKAVELAVLDGELAAAGGVHGTTFGTVQHPTSIVADTGGGQLDALLVMLRTL